VQNIDKKRMILRLSSDLESARAWHRRCVDDSIIYRKESAEPAKPWHFCAAARDMKLRGATLQHQYDW
jgi:hypothetical protein